MTSRKHIEHQLQRSRVRLRSNEDAVIAEANAILKEELFSENRVLENLMQYSRSFEVMADGDCNSNDVYTFAEIRDVALNYRLKFLDSNEAKIEIPYEAVLKIGALNKEFRKDLKAFKILLTPEALKNKKGTKAYCLFVRTLHDNYYLLHRWGQEIPESRRLRFWHLQTFENLVIAVLSFALAVTLVLPTELITLDNQAEYWSGYRGGVYFHLVFFFSGFTAYFMMAFGIHLSSGSWDRK